MGLSASFNLEVNVKIIRLHSENVKRLTAVDITPEGTLVLVGGKNGAGKSSVLDSIAYALGGNALVPAEPIRTGEANATIVVELDDYIITRKFRRDKLDVSLPGQPPGTKTDWGPTSSSLVVTNKEGARYPTPQALLDKLLGKLTFDPLAFATMDSKAQRETLRAIAGLDFSDLDHEKAVNANERTLINREVKSLNGQLEALVQHPNVPDTEVDVVALSMDLERANATLEQSRLAVKAYEVACAKVFAATDAIKAAQARAADLRLELAGAETVVAEHTTTHDTLLRKAAELEQEAKRVDDENIDPMPIRQAIKDADATNQKIRSNKLRAKTSETLVFKKRTSDALTERLDKLESERLDRLAAARFPVPGISLSDEGVTYGGVPLEQASSSERLRLSVAVGLALNPKLQVLLVRNGNQLDEDSLKALGEQAAAAGAQVWLEWVTKDASGMTVMIEDGKVI